MHFIDQYKELYPDTHKEPIVETPPVAPTKTEKPLPKPAVLPHAAPKHK